MYPEAIGIDTVLAPGFICTPARQIIGVSMQRQVSVLIGFLLHNILFLWLTIALVLEVHKEVLLASARLLVASVRVK